MLETATTQTYPQLQQKLHEEKIVDDVISIYDTVSFGPLIMINQQVLTSDSDGFFFHEMMAHPALFTHPDPKTVAIIGNDTGIVNEVLKHANIEAVQLVMKNDRTFTLLTQYFPDLAATKFDTRLNIQFIDPEHWVAEAEANSFDIIILPQAFRDKSNLLIYQQLLKPDGILALTCPSPLLNPHAIENTYEALEQAGFFDHQLFHFPQPSFPSGWRFAMMAIKKGRVKRIREKDIFNRVFRTRYYNYDVHKAALVLPEFLVDTV